MACSPALSSSLELSPSYSCIRKGAGATLFATDRMDKLGQPVPHSRAHFRLCCGDGDLRTFQTARRGRLANDAVDAESCIPTSRSAAPVMGLTEAVLTCLISAAVEAWRLCRSKQTHRDCIASVGFQRPVVQRLKHEEVLTSDAWKRPWLDLPKPAF